MEKRQRKFTKRHYFFAAAITAGIFFLGLLLGLVVEGKRVAVMQSLYEQQKTQFASSQLQFEYMNQLTTNESCPIIYDIFSKNTLALGQAQERLVNFEQNSKINEDDFTLLKRQYAIEEIRYYLFAKKAKDACGLDMVRLIYFYSDNKKCPDCEQQAFVLNYLKKSFGEKLLIFALDESFENEQMITLLKKQYNISNYPALILENDTFQNFQASDILKSNLCSRFKNPDENCLLKNQTTN